MAKNGNNVGGWIAGLVGLFIMIWVVARGWKIGSE